jgi:hypothetical protein
MSGRLFERSIRFAWPSVLNNIFGAIIGALKWGFFAGTLFLIISPLDSSNNLISKQSKEDSLFYNFTVGYTQTFMPGVKKNLVLGYDAVID